MANPLNHTFDDIRIRNARISDFELIVEIEQLAYDYPWSETKLKDSLSGEHRFYVMEKQGVLIGHLVLQEIIDEIHLYNVCVIPQYRVNGKGKLWMAWLKNYATEQKASKVILEVRASNQAAINLYLKYGFERVGERKNYYAEPTNGEDAIVMVAKL